MKTLDELLDAVEDDLNRLAAENAQLRAKLAAAEQQAARLRHCVAAVRVALRDSGCNSVFIKRVQMAVADLDAAARLDALDATSPAPASEPTGGAK